MSSNNLPPVRHLPHWTRVARLGKTYSPRPVTTSQPQPLPVVPSADREAGRAAELSRHSDGEPRVTSLQKNIQFLQQQHKETLGKLHAEIDYLRREKKELQYELVMGSPKTSRKGLTHSQRGLRSPTQGREFCTGLYLEEPLQDTRPSQNQAVSIREGSEILGSAKRDHGLEVMGGLITSLEPLRIHSSPSHPPRPPTLHECEVIIRQLYSANSLQSQEIIRVKALLRDIVMSKKITPENYILTKAYLFDGTRKSSEEKKFPKLGLHTFPEKISGPSQPGVILPALKQNLSSTIAERQRRTRAVQRGRYGAVTGSKLPQHQLHPPQD